MYELKNRPSIAGIRTGNFDFRPLEEKALLRFAVCPKLITLALHTSLAEISPVPCTTWGKRREVIFHIPRQDYWEEYTEHGIRYLLVRVINQNGIVGWLVVCEGNRQGFLINERRLQRSAIEVGKLVPTKRGPLRKRLVRKSPKKVIKKTL